MLHPRWVILAVKARGGVARPGPSRCRDSLRGLRRVLQTDWTHVPSRKAGETRDWDKEGANSRLPVLKATGLMADRQAEHPTRKDLDDYPAIMTLADYCQYYGISKQTGRHWIAEGRATRMPGHRHIKILRESVRNYERALLEESVSPAQQSSGDRRGA